MPALLAMLAVMTVALLLAMPSWRYLVRDDKEQELIFRGRQISSAVSRFQRKNGNALPQYSLYRLIKIFLWYAKNSLCKDLATSQTNAIGLNPFHNYVGL